MSNINNMNNVDRLLSIARDIDTLSRINPQKITKSMINEFNALIASIDLQSDMTTEQFSEITTFFENIKIRQENKKKSQENKQNSRPRFGETKQQRLIKIIKEIDFRLKEDPKSISREIIESCNKLISEVFPTMNDSEKSEFLVYFNSVSDQVKQNQVSNDNSGRYVI